MESTAEASLSSGIPDVPDSSPQFRRGYHRLTSSNDGLGISEVLHSTEDNSLEYVGHDISSPEIGTPITMKKARNPKRVSISSTLKSQRSATQDESFTAAKFVIPTSPSPDAAPLSSRSPDATYNDQTPSESPRFRPGHKAQTPSMSSIQSSFMSPRADYDAELLLSQSPGHPFAHNAYLTSSASCPPARPFFTPGFSWLAAITLMSSVFSTIFSGMFVFLAIRRHQWGSMIRTNGTITPNDAVIITGFLAKAIEITFVAVVVTFLGQALCRRAFSEHRGAGITLADLSMRSWILQPGTMISHPESLRYGGLSILGIMSLTAAVLTMFYSSAAQSLVQPQLRFDMWRNKDMHGTVKASFGNIKYITANCETPISVNQDVEYGASTCFQIQNSAQSFVNYYRYISEWAVATKAGNGSVDLSKRPSGFGLLFENTTITAPWIDIVNVTNVNGTYINNVSLAFPHPGVYQAARDAQNGILQPSDLDNEGAYNIKAAVASPVINVLCAEFGDDILDPLVYSTWPNASKNITLENWPNTLINGTDMNDFNISTGLDDIFRWGPKYGTKAGSSVRAYPIFPKYPDKYNTIVNDTQGTFYGRDSLYILGTGGGTDANGNSIDGIHALCEISASLTPHCSTRYNVTATGGTLEAICDQPGDMYQYNVSSPAAIGGDITRSTDWFDVASVWARSLSLDVGIVNGDASNARLLMQLLLSGPVLSPALPSLAEALAVMAGSTAIFSATDAPFDTDQWTYTQHILDPGTTQQFNASIQAQQYMSGPSSSREWLFMLVLVPVFVANLVMLVYFLVLRGLVTDFSEPSNLFALAINSPSSELLAGSCGGGPHGDQYKVRWHLKRTDEHLYMQAGAEPKHYTLGGLKNREGEIIGSATEMKRIARDNFKRLSTSRSLL